MRVFKSYCQNIYISGSNASMLSKELKTQIIPILKTNEMEKSEQIIVKN